MRNGIFDVALRSPLGPRTGTLTLLQNGDALQGVFSFFGKDNTIDEGTVNGNTYVFGGNIATAAGNRQYRATVEIINDELYGEVVFYLRTVPVKIPLIIPMKLTGKRISG